MKYLRPLLLAILLILIVGAVCIWWCVPSPADMTNYAPADALVYFEFNSLPRVIETVEQTDVWRATALGGKVSSAPRSWLQEAGRMGIGSASSVIFARSQVALVVLGLNSSEQNDTLKVKPDLALIVETHTSNWRVRPQALDAVKRLANFAYGSPTCTERHENVDLIQCSGPGAERKIVAAVDGSVVVIGNSDKAVQSCLEVRRGSRPSIRTDAELLKVRDQLASKGSLGFGYVSPANSAKLMSLATPLMFGKASNDVQLEKFLESSAAKILRGVAWTATSSGGAIEDHYLFALEPDVISRLQPAFEVASPDSSVTKFVPADVQSLSLYRSKRPITAWTSLDSALALKLEAFPAVLFSSILKSSLSVYGITDPKELLNSVSQPLLTLKPSPTVEGSILIGRVVDEEHLKRVLTKEGFNGSNGEVLEGINSDPKGGAEFTAVLHEGYVLMGKTDAIRDVLTSLRQGKVVSESANVGLELSTSDNQAAVVTYANDEARLRSFITTLLQIQGRQLTASELTQIETTLKDQKFSRTETSLGATGIERTTRSAFGQFSNLTSLLQ